MLQGIDHQKDGFRRNFSENSALLALGANLPLGQHSPLETLQSSLRDLSESGLTITACSRFHETPCFPPGAGPDYVNAAAIAEWEGTSEELLALLHAVEARHSRTRDTRWGMRTLDLDLLALGHEVQPDPATWTCWRDLPPGDQAQRAPDRLILPHPRMQDRAFVLVPLMEVAPDWRHPVLDRTVAEMTAVLPEADRAGVKPL